MYERVEIYQIDEEGILIRAFTEQAFYHFDGAPEGEDSPLVEALCQYYAEAALESMTCEGFDSPSGRLVWQSEMATPGSDDGMAEIGERLFLIDGEGERIFDEIAYETIADGKIPPGWEMIER
ncbi:MAG: hypothetical protein GC154_18525 [bacterium]|nr:hypothetical protein [bacterium]